MPFQMLSLVSEGPGGDHHKRKHSLTEKNKSPLTNKEPAKLLPITESRDRLQPLMEYNRNLKNLEWRKWSCLKHDQKDTISQTEYLFCVQN